MIPRNRPPPDFGDVKKWALVSDSYLYFNITKKEFFFAETAKPASKKYRWTGHVNEYYSHEPCCKNPEIYANGRTIDFFGKGPRIIMWGLSNDDDADEGGTDYEILSIFHENKWNTFRNEEFGFGVMFLKPAGVEVFVYNRLNDDVLFSFIVEDRMTNR